MPRHINVEKLRQALEGVAGLRFAVLFGSARHGELPRADSDVDVALALDYEPEFDEQARLIGLVQDAVGSDRVDVVLIKPGGDWALHREVLKGQILVCRDREAYASFFSLVDRLGRDEEARIARAWALSRELASQGPA
jgi:predicted nucleotidyltransferase